MIVSAAAPRQFAVGLFFIAGGVFMMTDRELVRRAMAARERAYAPYSGFAVGAALLCGDETVYTGCNIENASYPCGICAERVAAGKAVSEGRRSFTAIAVAGSSAAFCTPCGLCRQFLYEFAPQLRVLCANEAGEFETHVLSELLCAGFGGASLEGGKSNIL